MLSKEKLNETVKNAQKGDQAALGILYDAYAPALHGIALKIVRSSEVAEDVLQESFVKIWKNLPSYSSAKGSFFTWILNINRNTAIDKYRKLSKATLVSIQTNENAVYQNEGQQKTPNIDKIGLEDLIGVLPENQQLIIDYLYFKGYTQQETADELNLPLGTVKTRSRSALKELKELFILMLTWT